MAQRSIDSVAVLAQLRRLLRLQQAPAAKGAPWLHGEVARRMGERLALIRLQPQHLVEWWGGLGGADEVLRQAYPQARRLVVEPDAAWAALTQRTRHPPWWSARRWTGEPDTVVTEADPLPPAAHQLVWANMVLQAATDPPALFTRWQQALATDGFVMFSCLGPDTLKQLRALYARLGFGPPGVDFIDMHDLGDMLVHAGFADPVMDQELLTLTWATPEALLAELRTLGGNVAPARREGLSTPRWRRRLLASLEHLRGADGRLQLSVEIAYGHAFKAPLRLPLAEQTTVSLDDMRAMVRGSRKTDQGSPGLG